MRVSFTPNEHEADMLNFVMPYGTDYVVDLVKTPNRHIFQSYTHNESAPRVIMMQEERVSQGIKLICRQTFKLNGCDLITQRHEEEDHLGEIIKFKAGYPHIRLPESRLESELWEYWLDDNIRVSCKSSFSKCIEDGVEHEVLNVQKTMIYNEGCIYDVICCSTERYVAGQGMQSQVLSHEGMPQFFPPVFGESAC